MGVFVAGNVAWAHGPLVPCAHADAKACAPHLRGMTNDCRFSGMKGPELVGCLQKAILKQVNITDIIGSSCTGSAGVGGAFAACLNTELDDALPEFVKTCGSEVLSLEQMLSTCVISKAKQLLSSSVMETCAAAASLVAAFDKECASPAGVSKTSCYRCACNSLYVQGLVQHCDTAKTTTTTTVAPMTPSTPPTATAPPSLCTISLDCYDAGKLCAGSTKYCDCNLGVCSVV